MKQQLVEFIESQLKTLAKQPKSQEVFAQEEAYQKVLGFVATLRENPSISEPPIVHFKYRFDQTQSIWNATAIVRDKETTFGWISTKCTEDGKQLMFNVCYDTKQTGYIELGVKYSLQEAKKLIEEYHRKQL